MKPTELHKLLCKTACSIINTWANTNDIDSVTHSSDLGDFLHTNLKDNLSDSQIGLLEDELWVLYIIINKYGKKVA